MKNEYEKLTTEEILKKMKEMNQILSQRRELKRIEENRTKCINNITTKDFVVYWGSYGMRDEKGRTEYQFSFCIKHGEKIYDIYYEHGSPLYSWWPIVGEEGDDDFDRNGAFEFIPSGFGEACENSYEYNGTFDEAINKLKKYGFEDIRRSPLDEDADVATNKE